MDIQEECGASSREVKVRSHSQSTINPPHLRRAHPTTHGLDRYQNKRDDATAAAASGLETRADYRFSLHSAAAAPEGVVEEEEEEE